MATKTDIIASLKKQLEAFKSEIKEEKVGTVLSVGDGIARVSGLLEVKASEMLEFPGGVFGVVLNLEEDSVGIVLFGEGREIQEGTTVKSTGRIASVPVGDELIGRVINPIGKPLDGKG